MNDYYEMEELLPVVAELTAKYTRNESTSVTYERAEQLMGAVLYCIEEYESSNHREKYSNQEKSVQREAVQKEVINEVLAQEHISAKKAYELGYQKVLQKIEGARESYNEMIMDFRAYGNENYRDTVEKGIPGFFKLYDAKFAPQDTIITMDYPTIIPIGKRQGIDAIEQYIRCIQLEQRFLGALSEADVVRILTAYQADYRNQFYNICGIVFRELLGQKQIRAWILKTFPAEQQRPETFHEELELKLSNLLENLVRNHYDNDRELFNYLEADLRDFGIELETGYGLDFR